MLYMVREVILLMLMVVHRRLYGYPAVSFNPTDNTFNLTANKNGKQYDFESRQYMYTVEYSGLLKHTKVNYFYKVHLISNERSCDTSSGYYTSLISIAGRKMLHEKTTYGHRLAIDAHLDKVVNGGTLIKT